MRLRSPADLGLMPYRDHREAVGPSFAFYAPSSVDGRYAGYGYRVVDRETDSPKEVAVELGDEQGRYFWAPGQARVNPGSTDAIAGRRPVGSWWGGPAVGQIVESRDASAVSLGSFGSVTTPAAGASAGKREALAVLPYLDRSLAVDDRYAELRVVADRPPPIRPKESDTRIRVVLPPPSRELPADHPGIVAAGTEEHAQEALFVPAGGVLVSHWREDGPNRFSTLVYDVRGSRLDRERAAPLDTAWRVTALDDGTLPASTDPRFRPPAALAWVGSVASAEHDRAGRCLTVHSEGLDSGPPLINAYHAVEGGGPLTAGSHCQHTFFTNSDGEDFTAGHLQTGALFWGNNNFDGPQEFQFREYPRPPKHPFAAQVHLVFDSKASHEWVAGNPGDRRTGSGLWRWYAETNFGPYTPPPWTPTEDPPTRTPEGEENPKRRDVPAVGNPKKDVPVPERDRSGRGERRQSKKVFELGAARAQKKWFDEAGGRLKALPAEERHAPQGARGGQQGQPGQPRKHGAGANQGQARRQFVAGIVDAAGKSAAGSVLGVGQKNVNAPGRFGGFPWLKNADQHPGPSGKVGALGFRPEDATGAKVLPEGARRRLNAGLDPNPGGAQVLPEGARRRLDAGLDPNPGGAQVVPPGSPKRFQPGVEPVDAYPAFINVAPGLAVAAEAPTFEYTPLELGAPSMVAVPTRPWVPEEDLRYRRRTSAAEQRVNQSAPATGRLAAFGICNRGPQKAPGWSFTHRAGPRAKTLSGTGPGGLAFLPPELGLEDVLCGEPPTFHRTRATSATTFALLRTALGFLDCYDPRYGAVDGYVLDRGPSNGIRLRSRSSAGAYGSVSWTITISGNNVDFASTGAAGALTVNGDTVATSGGAIRGKVTHVTSTTYTVAADDYFLWCDTVTAGANIAITFPATSSSNNGQTVFILNAVAGMGSGNVTATARDTQGSNEAKTIVTGDGYFAISDNIDGSWYWTP